MMKIATLAGAFALAMTTAGFAQTTGPSGQQDTNKPGMANPTSSGMSSGSSMSPDGMKKSGTMGNTMSNQTTPGSTTGPSGGTPKTDAK